MRSTYTATYQAMLTRLREARRLAGMSQQEVAKAMKRPQSWVSNCESGERRIDVVELLEFGELYGQPLDFFLARP